MMTVPLYSNKKTLEPRDGFGVEVVRRFVEQQQIRFFKQQAGQGHAAFFTAG
jgi:hypothetical protein